jgi:hypothetical protein
MLGGSSVDYATLLKVANEGSPFVLNAVGRMFGLGQEETKYLLKDGIPTWTWVVIALGAGFFAGVRTEKNWPDKIPSIIRGK